MGIPVYFKTLVSQYQDDILIKKQINEVGSIFFDLNCLIHPCCRDETDESIMIQKIIDSIYKLVAYSNVTDLIYIAVDGVAPKGKMKQQQMRRHKSIYENKSWDTNAISPGTHFMTKLNSELTKLSFNKDKDKDIKVIINNSDERGEGEHKILQYIKNNQNTKNTIIYGLDADLIMLSLVSKQKNIFLLRERTEYNIEDTENEFIYLAIDELKQFIIQDFKIPYKVHEDILINDYIFICFLLGNDFINHLPSLNLRYNGYDQLIKIYRELQDRYQGYFRLIDTKLDNCIHLCFFKEFISELAKKEKDIFQKTQSIREKQYRRLYSQYQDSFNDFKKQVNKSQIISLEDIYSYQNDIINKEDVSEMMNHLPILFYPEEKDIFQKNQYYDNLVKDELCADYLDSLIWTSHYYFKECINWRWSTKYHKTPFLTDLFHYCKGINSLSFVHNNDEFSKKEQLDYIFPPQSHHLHPFEIEKKKNKETKVDLVGNRYLWECHIEFI